MRVQRIKEKLTLELKLNQNDIFEITDESHLHAGRKGQESHFKVFIVSDVFLNLSRIQRQRLVNEILGPEFNQGLHALTLRLNTLDEHQKTQESVFSSPDCQGGKKI